MLVAAEDLCRIGPYRVIGRLATGGMAEILLARVADGSASARTVVIKRVLPHLANDPAFVDMFVDEARIAVRLQHPNIVHTEQLVEYQDELFLVMEYLCGESLAGLVRRMTKLDRRMHPVLVAYVAAEVAAGLHAAHELTDERGFPLGIVHRDVSPHNIFLEYEGDVKILDFGIATGADRASRTQTGQLKGKFEYMSPEQCRGFPVDRRSDVFAMGTVLWELCTGRRLFRRQEAHLSLQAVAEGYAPPPTEVEPACPEIFDAICARALARDRELRYATADEMRHDLLAAMDSFRPAASPKMTMKGMLAHLFQERQLEKRQLLRHLDAGHVPEQLPASEADRSVRVPGVTSRFPPANAPERRLLETGQSQSRSISESRMRPKPKRRTQFPVYVLGALGLLLAAWWWAEGRPRSNQTTARSVSKTVAPMDSAKPGSASLRHAGSTRTGSSGASSSPSDSFAPGPPHSESSDEASPGASEVGTVELDVRANPQRVSVFLGDNRLGETPLSARLPRGTDPLELRFEAPGYLSRKVDVVPDSSVRLHIDLRRLPSRRQRRRARHPSETVTVSPRETVTNGPPARKPTPEKKRYFRFD